MRMTKPKHFSAFKGHRFPPEIISCAVWAYFRRPLSLRNVEDLLAARGIIVSYGTICFLVRKFGHRYAKVIRQERPPVADKWHLRRSRLGKTPGMTSFFGSMAPHFGSGGPLIVTATC